MTATAADAAPLLRRMRRKQASKYLLEVHNLEMQEKTLANRNAAGLEPKPEYLGTIPYYTPERLDAWAATAFTPESPVTVTRRRAAEAEARRRATERRDSRRADAGELPTNT